MPTSLNYAIRFVSDMDRAVRFHRDVLGLKLRFQSPEWTEFDTGATTLALHMASEQNPAGSCQLGFGVPDLAAFQSQALLQGARFTASPAPLHGRSLAKFLDTDGAECSVSAPLPSSQI